MKRYINIATARTLLCKLNNMVTTTGHIFINIFQMVHFSAAKITKDNETKNKLSSDIKISGLKKI